MSQIDPIFLAEATELLERLEATLLELEGGVRRSKGADAAAVNEAFRALHTLKGSGAMAGQDRLASLAHALEAAFEPVRDGAAGLSPALLEIALNSVDVMRGLLADPTGQREAEQILAVALAQVDAPRNVVHRALDPGRGGLDLEGPDAGVARLRVAIRSTEALGDDAASVEGWLEQLRALGPCEVSVDDGAVPELGDLDPSRVEVGWTVRLETSSSLDEVSAMFLFAPESVVWSVDPDEAVDSADDPASLAHAGHWAEGGHVDEATIASASDTGPAGASASKGSAAGAQRRDTVRVDAAKLDALLDMMGELVIAQSRLTQVAAELGDPSLTNVAETLSRLSDGIREQSMGLRMQPVGQVFQRFNRLVRDLGRQLDREVSLVTSGEDVEIDKSILDNLGDSLVHLIRNSVDHGLESGDERVEAGKPRAGRVYLRASQIDNSVVIEVGDDGRGLDLDRIFARGRERGLVGEVRPDDAALAQLIFEPGFSTAAAVTAVSGRGVGMDAVRRNIEAIGGRVDVSTQRGQGSCFRISLPLTLAIIDGLLFELGGERYVLPLDAVEECVEAPRRDATSSRQRLVEVRGEQVPYLSLREFLRVDVPGPDEQVVVANFQGRRFGFLVDAVVGQHQTVLKGLDPYSRVTGMAGATILGDGSVALVLDGQRIAELVSSRPTTALAS